MLQAPGVQSILHPKSIVSDVVLQTYLTSGEETSCTGHIERLFSTMSENDRSRNRRTITHAHVILEFALQSFCRRKAAIVRLARTQEARQTSRIQSIEGGAEESKCAQSRIR